jgi:hypothetical protein
MKRVLLEGAFYSPYASEGRWAFNVARLLSKMVDDVELYLLIPDLAKSHIYFKDFNPQEWFPDAEVVDLNTKVQYDVFFIIQGDNTHPQISAKKRIVGSFESYWYGNAIDAIGGAKIDRVVHAMHPYNKQPPHNNWPLLYKSTLLPYSPYYEPASCNFRNKGILVSIKDPCSPEFSEATIQARLDHFRAAKHFLDEGIKVTVCMGHRLDLDQNQKYTKELGGLLSDLRRNGASFVSRVSPTEMEDLVRNHSIIYTGKVNEVMLYATFMDGLCLGSVPIIFSDWPEQFFRKSDFFTPYTNINDLISRTNSLLYDGVLYSETLRDMRLATTLYTEWEGIEVIEELIR